MAILRLITALCLGVTFTAAFSNQQLTFRTTSPTALKAFTYLDDGNYHKIMTDKAVLVDACAQWCGPCKLIEPFLKNAAEQYADQLDIVKFDVEGKENGGVKVEFLLQGVMPSALPSLVLFRDGKHVATHTGALMQEELDAFIETNLQKASDSGVEKERELVTAEAPQGKGLISLGGMRDDYALS